MDYIEKEYAKKDFRFISITGRRRLGKTRLLEQFLKDRPDHCYLLIPQLNGPAVREEVARKLHADLNIGFASLPSWDEIFEELFRGSQKRQLVVVFDEFQRLARINESVFSYLQKHIDMQARDSRLFLMVSGSSIGMMHQLFEYAAALYGRRTGQLFFDPFDFAALTEWFPGYPITTRIYIYALYGGTPRYLEEVESENLNRIIEGPLLRTSILYNEPEVLLKTELRESGTYLNILRAIASGDTRSSQIGNSSGIKTTSMDYYLNILTKDLDLIKRETPVCDRPGSKKALYHIKDNFFRYWFRYIFPSFSELEMGNTQNVIDRVNSELDRFTAPVFEDICQQFLIRLNMQDRLPFTFLTIGRQWGQFKGKPGKNNYEIDRVAINAETKQILFCECKWQSRRTGADVLEALMEKAAYVDWYDSLREKHFVVISKAGFTSDAMELAARANILLFDLNDIDNVLC